MKRYPLALGILGILAGIHFESSSQAAMYCPYGHGEVFQILVNDAVCRSYPEAPSWRNGKTDMEYPCFRAQADADAVYASPCMKWGSRDSTDHPVQRATQFLAAGLHSGQAEYGFICTSTAEDPNETRLWQRVNQLQGPSADRCDRTGHPWIALVPKKGIMHTRTSQIDASDFETFDVTHPVDAPDFFSRKIEGQLVGDFDPSRARELRIRLRANLVTRYLRGIPNTSLDLMCEPVFREFLPFKRRGPELGARGRQNQWIVRD